MAKLGKFIVGRPGEVEEKPVRVWLDQDGGGVWLWMQSPSGKRACVLGITSEGKLDRVSVSNAEVFGLQVDSDGFIQRYGE